MYMYVSEEELRILCVGAAESSQAHLSFVKKKIISNTQSLKFRVTSGANLYDFIDGRMSVNV